MAIEYKSVKEAAQSMRSAIMASSQTKVTAEMMASAVKYFVAYEHDEAGELAKAVAKDEKTEALSKTPVERKRAKKAKRAAKKGD